MTFGSDRRSPLPSVAHRARAQTRRAQPLRCVPRKRFEQGGFVHDRSARGVDEPGAIAQDASRSRLMNRIVSGLRRHVQADEIGIAHRGRKIVRQKLEMIDRLRRRRIRSGAADNMHPIAERGNARHGAPDTAATDHRERLAVQVVPGRHSRRRLPCSPAPKSVFLTRRQRAASRAPQPTGPGHPACSCTTDVPAVARALSIPSWPTPKRAMTPPAGSES